jgi:hypothetical protein
MAGSEMVAAKKAGVERTAQGRPAIGMLAAEMAVAEKEAAEGLAIGIPAAEMAAAERPAIGMLAAEMAAAEREAAGRLAAGMPTLEPPEVGMSSIEPSARIPAWAHDRDIPWEVEARAWEALDSG